MNLIFSGNILLVRETSQVEFIIALKGVFYYET